MGNQRLAFSDERLALGEPTPVTPSPLPLSRGERGGRYDHWWDVPVTVTGTPNAEAVRLIEESVREFEDSQFVKLERPCPTSGCNGEIWMLPNGRKCGCDTCKSVFSIERLAVSG